MDLVEQLRLRLRQPLPGSLAQDKMKARKSTGEAIRFDHHGPPKQGGVALILFPEQGSWHFLLMKRTDYPGIHSGQISLPGGKKERTDGDLLATALRETKEELGISISKKQVIGSLSELYIVASHFKILPVVAVLELRPEIVPDEREVKQVITASLEDLLHPNSVKQREIMVRGYRITAPYFDVDNHVVWGATAMIVSEFLAIVKEISKE